MEKPTTKMMLRGSSFPVSIQELWPILLAASPLGAVYTDSLRPTTDDLRPTPIP